MNTIYSKILTIIFWLIIFTLGINFNLIYKIYMTILYNNELIILFATFIAGLFGFIIATIPFAIGLISQNTTFTKKLIEEKNFDFYIKPLFNRFIKFLNYMFVLFIVLIFIVIFKNIENLLNIQDINIIHRYILLLIFCVYFLYIIRFFYMLSLIIRDLKNLIYVFFLSNNKKNQ